MAKKDEAGTTPLVPYTGSNPKSCIVEDLQSGTPRAPATVSKAQQGQQATDGESEEVAETMQHASTDEKNAAASEGEEVIPTPPPRHSSLLGELALGPRDSAGGHGPSGNG